MLTLTINGIGVGFLDNKITIPFDFDFNDPAHIEALQVAGIIGPLVYHAEWASSMREKAESYVREHTTPDELDQVIVAGQKMLELGFRLDDQFMHFYGCACQEKDRRKREAAATARQADRAIRKFENPSLGYVYLLRSATGTFKIGHTSDPDDRMRTFSVKLPFEVEYEHILESADMKGLERDLHQRFAEKRINGEWFALTPEDVEYIKSLGDES